MQKDDLKTFLKIKDQVIDNLETIEDMIDSCTSQGMIDPGSSLYNEVLQILDEADLAKSYPELDEVITKGKEIEHNVETWLAMHGANTIELTWPVLGKQNY